MNILLDYFFKVTKIDPTPQASTGFLKQVIAIVKPKAGIANGLTGQLNLVTTTAGITALTDNLDVAQIFAGGLARVYVLPVAALTDVATAMAGHESDAYTMLISSDFTDANVTAATLGSFEGAVGVSSTDDAFLAVQGALKNRIAFHTTAGNKAKNLFYAIGKLLSNQNRWRNQQYISMPLADDVTTLGKAQSLFDAGISFVISDTQYGNRLALLAAGGEAVVAPYVLKNLEIDMQSAALAYVSGNQPNYTQKEASLVEDELDKVIKRYVAAESIEAGSVTVTLEQDNFVANGSIVVTKPKALWRIAAEMRQV